MVDRDPTQKDELEREKYRVSTSFWKNEPGFTKEGRDSQQKSGHSRNARSDDDDFQDDDYYANQGWTRSAAKERQRDWGYTNTYNYTRDEPLQIDFNRDEGRALVHDPRPAQRDEPKTE